LTSAELAIAKNLTINGPGTNVLTVRRAAGANTPEFRIFFIASGANVLISNLTLSNGRDYNSGAIYNDGATLTLNNCVFTDTWTGNNFVISAVRSPRVRVRDLDCSKNHLLTRATSVRA
jgi:hypothetical protein